jgi:RNA polymerase subunit RPABC4/transcription elongation factor Spt4
MDIILEESCLCIFCLRLLAADKTVCLFCSTHGISKAWKSSWVSICHTVFKDKAGTIRLAEVKISSRPADKAGEKMYQEKKNNNNKKNKKNKKNKTLAH